MMDTSNMNEIQYLFNCHSHTLDRHSGSVERWTKPRSREQEAG